MLVPVEQYDILRAAADAHPPKGLGTARKFPPEVSGAEVAELEARLEDPNAKWVDADQFALELAGQRIARARKAAGLTQKQLGDKLKLPQSQISRIERNPDHTTVRTIRKLAQALGVDVSALL